jgi:hypothetical protein
MPHAMRVLRGIERTPEVDEIATTLRVGWRGTLDELWPAAVALSKQPGLSRA